MISRRAMVRNFVEHLGSVPTSKLVEALAAELIVTRRAHQIDLVMADIAAELYEVRGELNAEVTTAHETTSHLRAELASKLKDLTGAKAVNLSETIDKELIGGLIIDTPTEQFDWSVRHKLDSLEGVN